MINECNPARCCLLLCKPPLHVAYSPLELSILQDFGLSSLHKSVKKFFACGGLRVSGHRAWLPCCLPAAHRVGLLSFRRHAFRIKSMPCFGVEVKRGIHCGGLCV